MKGKQGVRDTARMQGRHEGYGRGGQRGCCRVWGNGLCADESSVMIQGQGTQRCCTTSTAVGDQNRHRCETAGWLLSFTRLKDFKKFVLGRRGLPHLLRFPSYSKKQA